MTDETITVESEGLARAAGSFTVHGKKASVITFGSEWQSMSPEDRLKLHRSGTGHESKAVTDGSNSINENASAMSVDFSDDAVVSPRSPTSPTSPVSPTNTTQSSRQDREKTPTMTSNPSSRPKKRDSTATVTSLGGRNSLESGMSVYEDAVGTVDDDKVQRMLASWGPIYLWHDEWDIPMP
jgi:hypothetical protein